MNLTRREFSKTVPLGLLALSMAGSLSLEGCSVIGDIQNGLNAAQTGWGLVLAELEKDGILTATNPLVAEVNAAFTAAQAAIATYNDSPSTTTKQKIAAVLEALSAAIQAFLAAAPISVGPLLTAIVGALSIILSTIAGFLTELPAPTTTPSLVFTTKAGTSVTIVPQKRSVRAFKSAWNGQVGGYPDMALHVSFWQHF